MTVLTLINGLSDKCKTCTESKAKTFIDKAIEAQVDGLIAVCSGAGGYLTWFYFIRHAGLISPFALIPQV